MIGFKKTLKRFWCRVVGHDVRQIIMRFSHGSSEAEECRRCGRVW